MLLEITKAGDNEQFDYEHKILLHRKALIHLAHAEQWSEAVSLLENQPALKSALTKDSSYISKSLM